MTPIQEEIQKAIVQMSQKASFTEFQIIKKIRENTKFEGKKKAGIGLKDLMEVLELLKEQNIFYSIHVNSVNDCLLRKETEATELPLEAKQRRQKSEKSMEILTSGDIKNPPTKNVIKGKSRKKSRDDFDD